MQKKAFFVFNGDPICFIHVLLNAIDASEKNYDTTIIMEGAATKLLPELSKENFPLHKLWNKAKEKKLVGGVCKGCAVKMGTLESAEQQGLTLLREMSGHPSMADFWKDGYEVITF